MTNVSKSVFTRLSSNKLPWSWLRPVLIVGASLLAAVVLAFGILNPQPAGQIRQGQVMARDLAAAAGQHPGVQLSSGAYLPGSGIILYSRVGIEDRAQVLTWVIGQLKAQTDRLDEMSQEERLTWIVDYGIDPVHQEIIHAPLARAGESSTHTYYAAPPESPVRAAAAQVVPTDIELSGEEPASEPAPEVPAVVSQPAVAAEPVAQIEASVTPAAPAPIPVDETGSVVAVANPGVPVLSNFENGAVGWLPLAGEWVVEAGRYQQTDPVGFDYITMLQTEPVADYSLEARFRHVEGDLGAGLVYHAPAIDNRRGAHLVDLVEGGSFLRWGYYDENGDYSYQGGVQINPPVADGEWHTMRLVTRRNVSTIYLDNRELTSIENQGQAGHVGLLTSQAQVEFDDVTLITGAGQEAVAETPAILALPLAQFEDSFSDGEADGWQSLAGDWQVIEGEYHQLSLAETGQASISPFQGESYTVEAKIRHLDGAMEGGYYFNMTRPDSPAGSQMVGYTADGQVLQWGYVGEAGVFAPDGQIEVANGRDGQWHTLQLIVEQNRASVSLDGQVVVDNIPVTSAGGYVGLYTNQGSLAFDDIRMALNSTESSGQ